MSFDDLGKIGEKIGAHLREIFADTAEAIAMTRPTFDPEELFHGEPPALVQQEKPAKELMVITGNPYNLTDIQIIDAYINECKSMKQFGEYQEAIELYMVVVEHNSVFLDRKEAFRFMWSCHTEINRQVDDMGRQKLFEDADALHKIAESLKWKIMDLEFSERPNAPIGNTSALRRHDPDLYDALTKCAHSEIVARNREALDDPRR